ncbi:MAG: hypothetical protein GQ525_03055, partial [Draconibacterium sp.]|nr:hypothetical protein [Draconibacterium sp.]
METIILKTDLHCNSCVSKVEPFLKGESSIKKYSFNLNHPEKLVTIDSDNLNLKTIVSLFGKAGYKAERYL